MSFTRYNEDGSRRVSSSVEDALAVTPSDSANLSKGATKGIYIGGAGDLSVILSSGTTIAFTGLSVGFHPISATRVRATGTTATNIVAVY